MTISLERILAFLVALALLLNGLLYQYIGRVETKADATAAVASKLDTAFQVSEAEVKGLFERNKDRLDTLNAATTKFLDQARDSRLFEPKRAH